MQHNSQYSTDYHSNLTLSNISHNSKQGQNNLNQNNTQQTVGLNQQQNAHCYNWGAFAAHSALAAVGYNAPTLMQGNSQNVPTTSAGQYQTVMSPQSTNSSNIPYHQFASRNLPLAGYEYNYRTGGYLWTNKYIEIHSKKKKQQQSRYSKSILNIKYIKSSKKVKEHYN